MDYVNEEFGSDRIQILDTYEDVIEVYKEGQYSWGVLEPYLDGKYICIE